MVHEAGGSEAAAQIPIPKGDKTLNAEELRESISTAAGSEDGRLTDQAFNLLTKAVGRFHCSRTSCDEATLDRVKGRSRDGGRLPGVPHNCGRVPAETRPVIRKTGNEEAREMRSR